MFQFKAPSVIGITFGLIFLSGCTAPFRATGNLPTTAQISSASPSPTPAPAPAPAPAPPTQSKAVMFRGLVKGGVVHVLGGELPDGIFVKVIPE